MKFRFALKKMFTLLLLPSEMKYNFVSRVVGVKRLLKNVNKSERDIKSNMLEAAMLVFFEVLR